jgi:hypothetical protein
VLSDFPVRKLNSGSYSSLSFAVAVPAACIYLNDFSGGTQYFVPDEIV